MKTKTVLIILALIALLLIAANPLQEPDYTDLAQVLVWITGMGAVFLAGQAVAFVAENFTFWHRLHPKVKTFVPIGLAVLLGLGADTLLQYPAVLAVLAPIYKKVMVVVLLYVGTQLGYVAAKRVGYGAKAKLSANGSG